jgi:hypothetical protein
MPRLAALPVLLVLATGFAVPLRHGPIETRIVAPLADPAAVPGIGRCTSDGVCTVTDAAGTRRATPLAPGP